MLFVHGAGTPAEVAFDVPIGDYSWMAYLASAGFDVFSMDTTGYGRSTRPAPMNDPCNLAEAQQAQFVPALIAAPCAPTYPGQLTNIASDWDDIDAVVDYIRALRRVEKVSLVAWSLGGPRAGGYAAQHPDKVNRLVLLAPAYNPTRRPRRRRRCPPTAPSFNTQSRAEFDANWDRQVGLPRSVRSARCATRSGRRCSPRIRSARRGAPGVRRAPRRRPGAGTRRSSASTMTPTLMVAGIHDKQVPPDRVPSAVSTTSARPQKVLIDLGCSSHNAMWEKNHLLLFRASLEWLTKGAVGEQKTGVIRLGY